MRRLLRLVAIATGLVIAGIVVQAQAVHAQGLLAKVAKSGTLLIGTSNDAPLSYVDSSTKQPAGVIPDILREFLKRENIKATVTVEAMPFASLIPAIQSNRIDLMGDAMYIRPARQKVMDFTEIVFYNPESLDVPKGNPLKLHSLADLCGHSAGSYEGTTYIDLVKKASAACPSGKAINLKQYPTIQNVFADLAAGRIDAAVVDGSLSAYAIKQNPALNFELVGDYQPEDKASTGCALAVIKGDTGFVDAFNKTYAAMKQDGTAARLFEKWGLTPTDFFLKL